MSRFRVTPGIFACIALLQLIAAVVLLSSGAAPHAASVVTAGTEGRAAAVAAPIISPSSSEFDDAGPVIDRSARD